MKKIILSAIILALVACKNETKNTVIDIQQGEGNTSSMNGKSMTNSSEDQTIILFDGNNFNTWKGYGIDGMHDEWTIDGDAMVFTPSMECTMSGR